MLLASAGLALGMSMTLFPVADTTLFQNSPENNLGAIGTLVAGTTGAGQSNRALLKFDVAGMLPPSAVVQSVTLTLNVTKTIAIDTHRFRLHRMVRAWNEGTGSGGNTGQGAQLDEPTWNARLFPDQLWAEPGGGATNDFLAEPSAEVNILAEGQYDFPSTNLVSDVNAWRLDEGQNFGWILICADEAVYPSSRRFGSREDATYTPQLRIEYQMPERNYLFLVPVADTALFEYHPDFNLGASDLAAGSIGLDTKRTRALMRFDFGQLPPHAVVLAASLHLSVTRSGSGPNSNFLLHRLRRSWGEGNGQGLDGAQAIEGDATWNHRFFPVEPWSEPGGEAGVDYELESTAQTFGNYGEWEFTNVVSDIQFWQANPGTNFGWIMISDREDVSRTARRIASRETEDTGPYILIEYVDSPRIDRLEVSEGRLFLSFTALALNRYHVECREALAAGTWLTCTNLPAVASRGPVTVTLPMLGPQMFFRVELDP